MPSTCECGGLIADDRVPHTGQLRACPDCLRSMGSNTTEYDVIRTVTDFPGCTIHELTVMINRSFRSIHRTARSLVKAGRLKSVEVELSTDDHMGVTHVVYFLNQPR